MKKKTTKTKNKLDRQDVLELLYDEPVAVGKMLGFTDLTDLHNEWLKMFLYSDDDVTLQAHRGSYKTTTLSLFFALCIILFPNKTIIYFRKTDSDVTEITEQTKKILASKYIHALVQALYGRDFALTRATSSEISTDLSTNIKGANQLLGLGIGTSITGKHADIVVTDDICNVKDRVSKSERNRVKLAYQELQNIKNRDGRIINTGTPWHKDDFFSLIPDDEIYRYDCYSTGLITDEVLEDIKSKMTPSLFSANYELKHISDADTLFKDPKYIDNVEKLYGGFAQLDASYGGSDSTALTIMKRHGNDIVAYGMLWDCDVNDVLDDIKKICTDFNVIEISCELNADKGFVAKELRKRNLRVRTYHESMNKFIKISTYLRARWLDIHWLAGTDDDYMSQILDFSEDAAHDDAPDSAATLLRDLGGRPDNTGYTSIYLR